MTKFFKMDTQAAEGIHAAADALRSGKLVGLPTETVYGLGADATNQSAVAAIYSAKRRPQFNPLIVHAESVEAAKRLAKLGSISERLAAMFWPGPLTLVAPRRQGTGIADLATAGLETIAIRVPSHPIARQLLAAVEFPIVAPSANLSGRVSATRAEHVIADLGDRVAVILDTGPASLGIESTIIAVVGDPILLRPGAVPKEAIEAAIGQPLRPAASGTRPNAPGSLASHYAPSGTLRLNAMAVEPGESLLAFGPDLPPGADNSVAVVNLSAAGDLSEAAANLFSALRALDDHGAPIAAMPIPESGLGLAINDRLRRAAAPRKP